MRNEKHGCRVLGTAILAALFLMALTAGAAQAEGEWTIGGKTLAELKVGEESLTGSLDGAFTYTQALVTPGDFTIKCSQFELTKGKLLAKGLADIAFLFTKCALFPLTKPEEEVSSCIVSEVKINASGLATLHSTKKFIVFEPSGETPTLSYTIQKETECPLLAGEFLVQGSFSAEAATGKVTQALVLGNKEVDSLLGTKLARGTTTPTISATLLLSLSGANKSKEWGVV